MTIKLVFPKWVFGPPSARSGDNIFFPLLPNSLFISSIFGTSSTLFNLSNFSGLISIISFISSKSPFPIALSVKEVSVVGTPYVLSTFYNDGKFVLNILALDADSNPVELNSSNVKIIIDSVVDYYGTKTTNYSVKITNFDKITFKDGDMGLAMLFDGSGSMSSSDPNWLRKDAATKMIDYLASDRPNSMVGIFDFAVGYDTAYYFRVLQDFVEVGTNKTLLIAALDSLSNSGSTPLYDAMVLGCRKLEREYR